MSEEQLILPIIDSHIHLYPQSEVDSLAWYKEDDGALQGQHSVEEYKAAAAAAPSLLGFVFVETDRKHDIAAEDPDKHDWEGPLQEVRWMKRLALGQPKEGEGHTEEDKKLCLGLIPWAPLPSGPDAMEKYIEQVKKHAGDAWPKIKGFRYLVQFQPHGTMLTEDFIQSLKLLGRKGFVFEVGVDQHNRGKKQLEELIEMIDRAHDGVAEEEKVTLIINHLCKPDLTIYNITSDPSFHAWRTCMYTLSKSSNTYMKLSGGFSEMTTSLRTQTASEIFQSIYAWLGIVLATFGADRIMFGSDWPVCTKGIPAPSDEKEAESGAAATAGGGGGGGAWLKWKDVVEKMCWMATLSDEDRAMIFGGTAKKAYKL